MSATTLPRLSAAVALHVGMPGPAVATEVSALLNTSLGEGFTDPLRLAELAAGGGIVVRARDRRSTLLGAATARFLTAGEADALRELLPSAGVPESLLAAHRIGELKSAAVAPGDRGRGIGTRMLDTRLAFLRSGGARYVITASWLSADADQSSLRMLERAGFTRLAVVPGYWAADQAAAGYICPECGRRCTCTAAIMVLDLAS